MTPEQLKASILQYAMEGKLVKQDPNDEPASELLKRIENEKAELIREGKIKKSKKLPAISNDEEPFDIPDSWEWIRLGNICDPIRYGFTSSAKDNGNSKLVRITDIQNNNVNWNNVPFCDVPKVKLKDLQLKTNDILIARTGGTVGKSFVVKNISEVAVFASYLIRIRLIDNELIDFVKYFLDSPYYWQMISLKQSGTGQPNVNATKLGEILIPIPPLEEQKRIVAKIEKLMPLVDEYAESYNRLQKIDNEFEDKLKQSVLQYAMEGKLVKQDPSDEPASELIKKIENEKAELIKEGKIKKNKKLPAITDDEKPFDIPDSWEWVRLKQITTYGNFNSIKGSSIPDNSWVVDMKDVRKNGGGFSEIVRRKSTDIYKSNKYSFNKNAVLYGKLRPYLRKVEIAQTSGFTTTEMLPINVVDLSTLVPQYLRYAMLSPYFVNLVNDSMYGMKMPRVGTTFLAKMVVPLPPLEEQKRIVAKVEELQSSISNLSK